MTLPATRFLRCCVCALLLSAVLPPSSARGALEPTLKLRSGERLLVVAPHPDDETIGAGGLIQRVRALGGTVRIVLVTAGDGYVEAVVHETRSPRPRPADYVAYGKRRLGEARAAVRALAPDHARLQTLGFPDGGLEGLLRAHWSRRHPERSRTTGASDPPYRESIEPDACYAGNNLRRELADVIHEFHPTIIALADPHDRHPDHRATGLFALRALSDSIAKDRVSRQRMPRLLAFLVHWPNWPPGWAAREPARMDDQPLQLPTDLRWPAASRVSLELTDAEIGAKRSALAKHASQQAVMAPLLAAFVRRTEPFTLLSRDDVLSVGYRILDPAGTPPLPR